jgi:uncharacterized protein YeeX (DUF496 family)
MARPKSNSDALQKLTLRVNGLKTIKGGLNSTIISVSAGEALKNRLQTKLDEYNIKSTELNNLRREIVEIEAEANEFSKTVFYVVKGTFGDQSAEYQSVGGQVSPRRKTKLSVKKNV